MPLKFKRSDIVPHVAVPIRVIRCLPPSNCRVKRILAPIRHFIMMRFCCHLTSLYYSLIILWVTIYRYNYLSQCLSNAFCLKVNWSDLIDLKFVVCVCVHFFRVIQRIYTYVQHTFKTSFFFSFVKIWVKKIQQILGAFKIGNEWNSMNEMCSQQNDSIACTTTSYYWWRQQYTQTHTCASRTLIMWVRLNNVFHSYDVYTTFVSFSHCFLRSIRSAVVIVLSIWSRISSVSWSFYSNFT